MLPAVPAAPAPGDTAAAEKVVTDRLVVPALVQNVATLSATPRVSGSPEYMKAAEWVRDQAIAAGWDAKIVKTRSQGSPWSPAQDIYNVIADRRGTAPDGERKLVLAGAHLDSVPRGPGANDDGSGSSTMLEVAKALKGVDTQNDIRLMWFDGEERGLLGSNAYAHDNPAELKRAVIMINADMTANPHGPIAFDLGKHTADALGPLVQEVATRNGVQTLDSPERHSRSDHASFDAAGVPSVDFGVRPSTVDQDDPNYHKPSDTVDKLNTTTFKGYANAIGAAIVHWGNVSERTTGPSSWAPGVAGDPIEPPL